MPKIADITDEQIDRFWAKVERGAPAECWNWTAAKDWRGYGRFGIWPGTVSAHRVAFYLGNNSIDDDLVVMHACDNRACCNPAHLSQGTQKDNLRDMWKRGRAYRAFGAGNGRTKLNEDIVREIRISLDGPRPLARRYGVDPAVIRNIRNRKIWKHVP
jgi:hypothetical protein